MRDRRLIWTIKWRIGDKRRLYILRPGMKNDTRISRPAQFLKLLMGDQVGGHLSIKKWKKGSSFCQRGHNRQKKRELLCHSHRIHTWHIQWINNNIWSVLTIPKNAYKELLSWFKKRWIGYLWIQLVLFQQRTCHFLAAQSVTDSLAFRALLSN